MKRVYPSILLVVFLSIGLMGCSHNSATDFVIVEEENVTSDSVKPRLAVEIKVDGDTATVLIDTDLKISAQNYGSEKVNGEGHIHLYLDNGEKQGVKQKSYVLENLEKGQYVVRVSLHNNDHTPYGVTETVEFEIK
ncbi:hypothetical protein IMZ08_07050 [Bacillus luteolus]|uniref:YtkA-like domain-containing protein n=1 Tax=Litchfieldia luteola TaxID=682179 RepID=A0ABR9QH44_9BACI|nr:hypothetical protein [Cytobacillus luteolus]MBE4907809.1 hypothetical protein [Cytobacillus luteolus]MBP1944034.1 hypothetical protein [Cytobacillus luteolus]